MAKKKAATDLAKVLVRQAKMRTLGSVQPHPKNPNKHPKEQLAGLADSIKRFGFIGKLVAWKGGLIIAGNGTYEAARLAGMKDLDEVPVIDASDLPEPEAMAFMLADNALPAKSEPDLKAIAQLVKDHDLKGVPGYTTNELSQLLASLNFARDPKTKGALADRFMVPPFSIIDSRQSVWKKRKAQWLELGTKTTKGRGKNLKKGMGVWQEQTTSVYDPVLAELLLRWFAPPSSMILDPFAGGSQGLVAQELGHTFVGIELRAEQVKANQDLVDRAAAGRQVGAAYYIEGDAQDLHCLPFRHHENKIFSRGTGRKFDLLFSCPPYHDLEVYSKDPKDLSTMTFDKFMAAMKSVMAQAYKELADNSFAVLTVGEVRDKKTGLYKGLVPGICDLMSHAGFELYNELIYIGALGSMPLRAAKPFEASRKVLKAHQNVLVFVKGDPVKATKKLGQVKVEKLDGFE